MRVWSRIALVVVFVVSAPFLFADHFIGECPLSLVDSTPAATEFDTSPHGVFRNGNLVHVLRGNILATYNTNDVGNLSLAREDFLGSLAGRETEAGVAFSAGYLFISSEAGLEIYDLRNVRTGGNAPILVTRRPGLHYRRLAVNGTRLAGLYPATDMPCFNINPGGHCFTTVDIYSITTISAPTFVGKIDSRERVVYRGFNDIAFNFGFLIVLSDFAVAAYNVSNPASPILVEVNQTIGGKWLVSNHADFLAVGDDTIFRTFRIDPLRPFFNLTRLRSIAPYLTIERANALRFNRQPFYDEANGRFITLVEEIDPITLKPARTIAFDVFDFSVPFFEGAAERIYEDVTQTFEDEIKYNPVAVGPFVYTIGEESGMQSWGACAIVTGRIELDSINYLTCRGAEIHGWVTGTQKIVNVELFLDNTSLGAATVGGPLRTNVSSSTPVFNWRINVNLDSTAAGEHLLRAIGTDALGNRRQFAFKRIFFPGSPNNCVTPRRRAVR
ncbi:MAG TPA: hypothetical protein VNA69_16565 [Thermoanaerobaculia bacterium]|nr:hypothetical protein [Thermoanaerobaculia bacterium]